MARRGVLSDAYIKATNPQYFPLDLGSQDQFASITLPTHNLDDVLSSKSVCITVGRRPIMDLHNFASVANQYDSAKYEAQAITQYKQLIHNVLSHNQISNLSDNEVNEVNEVNGENVNEVISEITNTQTMVYDTQSPSLNLHFLNRKAATQLFRKEVGGHSHQMLSVRSRHMLSNLVDKEDFQELLDKIHPDSFNPKFKQLTDHEVLDKLITIYPDDINKIQTVFDDTLVTGKGHHFKQNIDSRANIIDVTDGLIT